MVAVFVLLAFLTLALMILAFPVGIYTYYFTSLSTAYSASSAISGVYFFVGPSVGFLPLSTTFGAVFMALLVIYAAMLVLAARQGRSLFASVKASFREGFEAFFTNNLMVAVISISFLIFTVVLFDQLETSSGIPIGGLSGDAFELLSSLTIAPLREEIGFRLLMIGILTVVACVGLPWKTALKSFWRPSAAYEARGGDTVTTAILAVGLVISSVTFGLVHIYSGSGWEIGKLPVATYAGFVLGYLYIKYGLHMAVLAHWGTDFFSSIFAYMGQGAPSGSAASNLGYFLDNLLSVDMLSLMGLASFLVVSYMGAKRFARWRSARERARKDEPAPTSLPQVS